MGQGMPRIASKAPDVGEGPGADLLSQPQKEPAFGHLDFRLLASRAVREEISALVRHTGCGTWLGQHWKTNTEGLLHLHALSSFTLQWRSWMGHSRSAVHLWECGEAG